MASCHNDFVIRFSSKRLEFDLKSLDSKTTIIFDSETRNYGGYLKVSEMFGVRNFFFLELIFLINRRGLWMT